MKEAGFNTGFFWLLCCLPLIDYSGCFFYFPHDLGNVRRHRNIPVKPFIQQCCRFAACQVVHKGDYLDGLQLFVRPDIPAYFRCVDVLCQRAHKQNVRLKSWNEFLSQSYFSRC